MITTSKGSLGSGVVANGDGTILTAAHVVGGAGTIDVAFADGTETTATVASSDEDRHRHPDPGRPPRALVPATLGGAVEVGPVVAIGNPLGLAASASAGVVSGSTAGPTRPTARSRGSSSSMPPSTPAARGGRS